MCSIIMTIVDPIVECLSEVVIGKVKSVVGYIIRYNKNLNDLEDESKNLEKHMEKVDGKVEEAKTEGEIIEDDVEEWRQQADERICEAKELMKAKANNENNLISRYKMSKQAEQIIAHVKSQAQKGNFDKVSKPAPPPQDLQFPSRENYLNFNSRASLLKEIKEALAAPTVKIIGLYGLGGVGKTTTVEEVGKQVKNKNPFDEVVIAVVSQEANVHKIQGQIADRLNLKLKAETEWGRASELWNRLNNEKKNLVILDDLWKELDLKRVGIPLTDGRKGCKVILTTRFQRIVTNMEVNRDFSVEVLSEHDAWELFEKKVGINFDSTQLRSVAESVCKECGGLPLAILAVGAALRGKEGRAWKDALHQLQNSSFQHIVGIDPKVYASLRLSYDCLGKEQKSCMLLCCLYPEDAEITVDSLVYHCMARRLLYSDMYTMDEARCRVSTIVKDLKTCSLLLCGRDEGAVKMHDIVRDVVVSIAKIDEEYIVKHNARKWPDENIKDNLKAISISLENVNELPHELVCPQLHTLMLDSNIISFEFPDNFFSGVQQLKSLQLHRIHMLSIPSSLANMSNVRMLYLQDCVLKDVDKLKFLKNTLEVLSLRNSDFESLPSTLGELSHLRVLNMEGCRSLKQIPADVISKWTKLEELYIPQHYVWWEDICCLEAEKVEASKAKLAEICSLTGLTTLYISIQPVIVKVLMDLLCLDSLIRYEVTICPSDPEYHLGGEHFVTKILALIDVTLNDVLISTALESAELLELCKIKGLRNVFLDGEGKLKRFSELKYVYIESCFDSDFLFADREWHSTVNQLKSNSFSKLTELYVTDCNFKCLFSPSCAKGLEQLQQLEIRKCRYLEEIVGTDGEKDEQEFKDTVHFSKLERLQLEETPKLISFFPKMEKNAEGVPYRYPQPLFNEKVSFPALEDLRVLECPNIKAIWDKQLLPTQSRMFKLAQNLKSLDVTYCNEMEVVFSITRGEENEDSNDHTIIFQQLRTIRFCCLQKLKRICGDSTGFELQCLSSPQVSFPALEDLRVWECPNIKAIWDKQLLPTESRKFTLAQNLKSLSITYCNEMEVIFSVTRGEENEVVNNHTITFPELRTIHLNNLQKLKRICGYSTGSELQRLSSPQVSFPALEDLNLTLCPHIKAIWEEQLPPIESCTLAQNLKSLSVEFCEEMEVVVSVTRAEESEIANNHTIIFPQLRTMSLLYLKKLKCFYGDSTRSELQQLFGPQVSFPALEDLEVFQCQSIKAIWDKQLLPTESHMAQNLKSLSIRYCKEMEVVVSITGAEESEINNNHTIIFPQLRKISLQDLENLKCFYGDSTRSELQHLFGPQVAFHALEVLSISKVPNITGIWDKKVRPTMSFPLLKDVRVFECHKLVNIFPSNMLSWVQKMKEVRIENCKGIEVVVLVNKVEESEGAINHTIVFPDLKEVTLVNLENLKSFCGNSRGSEPQHLFDPQVQFPALETIVLRHLPNIKNFEQQLLKGEVKFLAIKMLSVNNEFWYWNGKPDMKYLGQQLLE